VDAYCVYIEALRGEDPRLQVVDDYISKERLHNQCPQCTLLDCTLINIDSDGRPSTTFRSKSNPRLLYVNQAFQMETEALGKAFRTPGARKVLICEDLQPEGAKAILFLVLLTDQH
jgi:hypothetical protein